MIGDGFHTYHNLFVKDVPLIGAIGVNDVCSCLSQELTAGGMGWWL